MLLCKQRNLKISPDIYECSSMTLPPNKRYFLDLRKTKNGGLPINCVIKFAKKTKTSFYVNIVSYQHD